MRNSANAAWLAGLTAVFTLIGGFLLSERPGSWPLWLAASITVLSAAFLTALQASHPSAPPPDDSGDHLGPVWRRRLTLITAGLLGAAVVAIPVALVFSDGPDDPTATLNPSITATPTASTATSPTTTSPTTTSPPSTPASSTTARRTTSATPTEVEPRLSGGQTDLYDRVNGYGVAWSSCQGHPDGEDIDGVTAAIQCNTIPELDLKISMLQFRSATAADSWLSTKSSQVDNPGRCATGGEESTTWEISGVIRGPLICIDVLVRGNDHFTIIWGFRGTGVVMEIWDASADTAYRWWRSHGDFTISTE